MSASNPAVMKFLVAGHSCFGRLVSVSRPSSIVAVVQHSLPVRSARFSIYSDRIASAVPGLKFVFNVPEQNFFFSRVHPWQMIAARLATSIRPARAGLAGLNAVSDVSSYP